MRATPPLQPARSEAHGPEKSEAAPGRGHPFGTASSATSDPTESPSRRQWWTTTPCQRAKSTQWPGRVEAKSKPFSARADTVQQAIEQDVRDRMGDAFNPSRFIAYVSMHEFEALLFSDCDAFAQSIGLPAVAAELQGVRDSFDDPEQIDDSRETAPSKRILHLVPTYDKVAMGSVAIQEIGLHNIRSQCPNFHHWLATRRGGVSLKRERVSCVVSRPPSPLGATRGPNRQ